MSTDLIQMVIEQAERSMDAKGIYPSPGFGTDAEGKLTMFALAFDGGDTSVPSFWAAFIQAVAEKNMVEVIFTSDRYALEGQGVPTSDFLAVFHWRAGEAGQDSKFRYGVMPYSFQKKKVYPIDWDHPFWLPHLRAERVRYCPFLIRTVKTQ